MIIYVESQSGRKHYVINRPEDFEELFQTYPRLRDLTLYDEDLADAAETVVEYLSNHHQDAWIEGDDLNKGLKEKALALGLAASMVPGQYGMAADRSTSSLHPTAQVQQERLKFGQHPNDSFLWTIQQIESSGGQNIKHKEISSGPQKGQTAMGRWGMLKPTVEEFLRREKTRTGALPAHLKVLEGKSRDQMSDHFANNPDVELDLARMIGKHVLRRHGGNEHKAAYSWLHGHNLMSGAVSPEMVSGSEYVKRYQSLRPKAPFKFAPIKKSQQVRKISKNDKPKKHPGFVEKLKVWAQQASDKEAAVTPSDPGPNARSKSQVPDPKTQAERIKAVLASKKKYIQRESADDSEPNF